MPKLPCRHKRGEDTKSSPRAVVCKHIMRRGARCRPSAVAQKYVRGGHFFSLLPLYKEEMDFKVNQGPEALFEKLEAAGVNELLRADCKNVCKKRFGLF
ncbi:suppressor of fused domain protein [Cohnella rhizosphaerae]|uniref:Suppressor of fused domain protein n=1 Tax=Cohnella rhizosphaerae TaxID=1457232 RepID=A0A9X4KS94_9BACL|nr:suppressor of fused domain protein [Cohnella rhizosphaerae]MDG0809296.1 suppressor of fused domain protein [Cohnella rhizosphaerae]